MIETTSPHGNFAKEKPVHFKPIFGFTQNHMCLYINKIKSFN